MHLLVSVRDPHEARAALDGGARIVDAKEPSRGPLAPVDPGILRDISAAVPAHIPLSVALGDCPASALAGLVSEVAPLAPRRTLYFKAALTDASPAFALDGIISAVAAARRRPDHPALVIARYVDAAGDLEGMAAWVAIAARAGARGLLLDTRVKGGASLLAMCHAAPLASLRRLATRHGSWLALAGGVTLADLDAVRAVRPHVVGVRGAVCTGGRTGPLSTARVAELRLALEELSRSPRRPATRV
jgi:(5-formylfuran-3-yl)methyl phosphate synthase